MSLELQSVSDEELARQSQDGSLPAFEELVHRYEVRIYRFVAQSCRNGADAGEITQETFVRAFQAIAQFNSGRRFASWLFTIAHRKCIDHHRRAPPTAVEPPSDLADPDDPVGLLVRQEERQDLWALARRCLPPIQFQALWLKYVEEMDVAAVACALRKTRTHTKVLLFRARRTLGHQLEQGRTAADRTSPTPLPARQPILSHSTLKQPGLSLR